jgi:hypothetical protein
MPYICCQSFLPRLIGLCGPCIETEPSSWTRRSDPLALRSLTLSVSDSQTLLGNDAAHGLRNDPLCFFYSKVNMMKTYSTCLRMRNTKR